MDMQGSGFAVYGAIAAVIADLSHEGIAKVRKNTQQGYNFRGIDDVYNALAPALAKHKLCVLPRVLRREVTERASLKGGTLFSVVCDMEFDLVSAEDGSRHTIAVIGEAMDSGDKATNKAMSAAYKYAAMQAFCIPTEGDNDADAQTHEVAPRALAAPRVAPPPPLITAAEVTALESLIERTGTDTQSFVDWLGFKALAQITSGEMYTRASGSLTRKLDKQAAAVAGEVAK